jgi:16S rRNA (adenine1518-N6/adenine1519-N6)-dimethyltransferase
MVQKEVAEVIAAGPGQRSVLSISVQFYGKPEIVTCVPAASFYPVPNVDSAVVKIDVYPQPPVDVNDPDRFFKLVKAGFKAARKQAANSLSKGLAIPKNEALDILNKAGIDPIRRAETFTLEEWGSLWRAYNMVVK